MKLLKIYDNLINESTIKTAQEVGMSDKIFYHGTLMKIDKLDPMFRQSNADTMSDKHSGSISGVGIYFTPQLGFDPSTLSKDSSPPQPSTGGENAYKWTIDNKDGYIYAMKLKPTANIIDTKYDEKVADFTITSIGMENYKVFRENGVDAVWDNGELVLLNQDAVGYFKLVYKVVTRFKVAEVVIGKPKWDTAKLLDEDEVEPYLKQTLGDEYVKQTHKGYDMYIKPGERALGVSKERNQVIPV